MSKDKYKAPQGSDSDFVDEILAEARKMRGDTKEELNEQDVPLAQARPVGNLYEKPKQPVPQQPVVNPPAPEMAPPPISPELPQQPAPQPGSQVVDHFGEDSDNQNKKKRFGKKQRKEITAGKDDIYYGLKLNTVEEVKAQRRQELKEGYEGGQLKVSSPTSTFAHLFEDNEPDTSPEFQEKFHKLHQERQERVKQAAKEAGAEVEDVFSLYEEPSQMERTFTGLEIPKDESPEKIVEEMVSEAFSQPSVKKDYRKISLEELYEEDLLAEKQSAELRQLIDDVLAKETVVEVDPPLHTESIFGLVAKERAQDTVDAEIAEEAAKLIAEQAAAAKQKVSQIEEPTKEIIALSDIEDKKSQKSVAANVAETHVPTKQAQINAPIAKNVEETPKKEAEPAQPVAQLQEDTGESDDELIVAFDELQTILLKGAAKSVQQKQIEKPKQNVPHKTQSDVVQREQTKTKPEAVQKEQPEIQPGAVQKQQAETQPVTVQKEQPETQPEAVQKEQPETKPVTVQKEQSETKPVTVQKEQPETKPEAVQKEQPEIQPVTAQKEQPETQPVTVQKEQPETKPEAVQKEQPETQPATVQKEQSETQPVTVQKEQPETQPEAVQKEQIKTQAETAQKEQLETQPEPAQEQAIAAKFVEEKDIEPITKPVEYVFHTRPVRTFAIAGIGDVLAQEAKQFVGLLQSTVEQPTVQQPNPKVQQTEKLKAKQEMQQAAQDAKEHKAPNETELKKEPIQKTAPVGPKVIKTSRFQIIDKTHMHDSTEESSVEHIEPEQNQQESAPTKGQREEPFDKQPKDSAARATQQQNPVDQDKKIVNIKDMKEQQAKDHQAINLKDMEQVPEYLPKKKKSVFGRNKMKILSDIEDEEEDIPDEIEEEQPELEDFQSKEDVRSISGELRKNIRTLFLRATITGICTAVLLALGFFAEYHIFGAYISPIAYAVTSLVFLVIAIGIGATTIFNGLKSLVKLRASADAAIAIATVIVAIQSIVLLFMQDSLATGNVHVYTSLITGGLLLNTLGKLAMVRRIKQNFSFVASNTQKNTVELVEHEEIAAQLAKDCVAGVPVVAYQKKSKFFGHFLKNSYAQDCSEQTSQIIAPLGFISSLVLFIVSLIISKDIGTGFTAFAAAMCICVPMANMLCVHLPVSRLCKLARKNGGMLVGYQAVDKFADTNAIMIEADDLFPKDTVELKGIKTFGEQRIDKVLLDAAALMNQVGGPLSEVFLEVVKNHEDILPHVENVAYQDECGVIGWVSGRRILVGNRDLMNFYSIDVPAVHIDKQQNQQLVYIAADGDAVGAFILAYHVSHEKKQEMQRMARNGIGIIVKTTDPCVTSAFISEQFGIDIHTITVLSGTLVHTFNELTGKEEETSNAMFATKGKAVCMMRVITACVRERSNISIVRLLQNISVILGFVLVAFLVCFSGLRQISTLAMLIYQVFWLIVLLVLPKIRRS